MAAAIYAGCTISTKLRSLSLVVITLLCPSFDVSQRHSSPLQYPLKTTKEQLCRNSIKKTHPPLVPLTTFAYLIPFCKSQNQVNHLMAIPPAVVQDGPFMSDDTFLYAIGAFAIVTKIVVISHIIHRRRHPQSKPSTLTPSRSTPPTSNTTDGAISTTAATTEVGRSVLVEDPMTQRILYSLQDPASVVSLSEIKLPPPVYTPKDLHLEFSSYDPPPPFAAEVNTGATSSGTSAHNNRNSINGQRSSRGNRATGPASTSIAIPSLSTSTVAVTTVREAPLEVARPERTSLPVPRRTSSLPRPQSTMSLLCPTVIVHM